MTPNVKAYVGVYCTNGAIRTSMRVKARSITEARVIVLQHTDTTMHDMITPAPLQPIVA